MTLNTTRSYVPYIYVTSIHKSQISLHFALRRAVFFFFFFFEMQVILGQVHRITPNWSWALQCQTTLYMYHNCPRVSNVTLFRSTTRRFRVTSHFDTSAPNEPKWPWTPQGQRYTTYVLLVFPSPKFHPVCSATIRFQDTAHFIIPHWPPPPKKKAKISKLQDSLWIAPCIFLTTPFFLLIIVIIYMICLIVFEGGWPTAVRDNLNTAWHLTCKPLCTHGTVKKRWQGPKAERLPSNFKTSKMSTTVKN